MNCELNNRFSWHRFGMVARFYYPRLKKQLILYPSLSLLTLLATLAVVNTSFVPYSLLTPLNLLTTWLLWLGPAVFTLHEGPETETLLPAKGSEKALFIMLYAIVGIPVLIHIFSFATKFYAHDIVENIIFSSNTQRDLSQSGMSINELHRLIDSLSNNIIVCIAAVILSIFPCIVTLYVVVRARAHRIIWAIVWNVVYFLSMFVLLFIAGFVAAITGDFVGKFSAIPNDASHTETTGAILNMTLEIVTTIFSAAGVYSIIIGGILLILTYRTIVNRQVA